MNRGQNLTEAKWNDAGTDLRAKLSEISQQHGHTYIFAVKAINGAGLSSIGQSNGIAVDASAPYIPKVTLLNAVDLGDPKTATEQNYITSNQGLGLWIDSVDPESAIAQYYYAYGAQTTVDQAVKTTSATATNELANPAIKAGEVTLFKGECLNNADLLSPAGYSTGVMLDSGAPKIVDVTGGDFRQPTAV